jgi:hypothetical protein
LRRVNVRDNETGGFVVKISNDGKTVYASSDGVNFRVAKTKEVIAFLVAVQQRNDKIQEQLNIAKSSQLVRAAMKLAMFIKGVK